MTTYPTNWDYGKVTGNVSKRPTSYNVSYTDSSKIQCNKTFSFSVYGGEQEAENEANLYLRQENTKHKIAKNMIRYLDKNTIEVMIKDNVTFKTDAKFFDAVEESKIHTKAKKLKDGTEKLYVVYQDQKHASAFVNKITTFKSVKYIDGNTLNLTSKNLKEVESIDDLSEITVESDYKIQNDININTANDFNNDIFLPKNTWILGKNDGTIFKRKGYDSLLARISDNNKKKHEKEFKITESEEHTRQLAENWLYVTACKLNVTKNFIRIIDDEYIEVALTQDICMLTDKILLPLIQKLRLFSSSSSNFMGVKKFFACFMLGKSVTQFSKFLMGNNTCHLNNNLLDNRLINLFPIQDVNNEHIDDNILLTTDNKMNINSFVVKTKIDKKQYEKIFYFKKDDKTDEYNARLHALTFNKNIYNIDIHTNTLEFTGHETLADLCFLEERLKNIKIILSSNLTMVYFDFLKQYDLTEKEKYNIYTKYLHIAFWRETNLENKLKIVRNRIQNMSFEFKLFEFENSICYNVTRSIKTYDELENILTNEHQENFVSNQQSIKDLKTLTKYDLKELEHIVKFKGGSIVTKTNEINSLNKIKFTCKQQHEFCVTYEEFTEQCMWCKTCEKLLSGKLKVTEVCKKLFQLPFKISRPEWLRNTQGVKLELDSYCEELKLAIEYREHRHYKFDPTYHDDEKHFRNIQDYNKSKERLCIKNNVTLIIIPYTTKINDIEEFILNKLDEYNIKLTNDGSTKTNVKQLPEKICHDENKYYTKLKSFAEAKCGKLLSEKYESATSKVKVLCSANHTFQVTPNNLYLGKWCSFCATHQMEFYLGKILEHIFTENAFIKVRPCWLKFKNNANLELDYYCEELKLAFEYNGKQHYEFIPFFHKSEEAYELQVVRDKYKEKMCEKEGVKLIIIPCTVDETKMYTYILSKLDDNDIAYNYPEKKFDISTVEIANKYFDKTLEIIEQKGGKLISGTYVTRDSEVTIQCNIGHKWTTNFAKILSGSWCHTCGLTVSDDTKTKISGGMKKFNESEEGKELKKKSHEKRSLTMMEQRNALQLTLTHKLCKHCMVEKEIFAFNKKSDTKDGLQSYCKECIMKIKQEKRKQLCL